MELINVTPEDVFNVERVPRRPRQESCTRLSLTVQGKSYFGLEVPGAPHIEAGHRLTALCRKPGDLSSIAGWQNHTTGELVLPSFQSALLMALLLAVISILTWMRLPSEPVAGMRVLKALGGGVTLLWSLGALWRCRRVIEERALLRSVPNERLASDVGTREPL